MDRGNRGAASHLGLMEFLQEVKEGKAGSFVELKQFTC